MDTTELDTVVIGAGAAGLHTARLLAERGINHLLIDADARVGDTWRHRYRSLRLFTPRRWAELPGVRLGIGYFAYPTGAEFGDYLERCATAIGSPLRLSTRVSRLSRDDGRFRLALSTGQELVAARVVVAAGAHHVPIVPAAARDLDPAIRTVHSLDYQGPEDFARGPVLVVGAGNSGTDIALEAAAAGHATTLAGRHPGQVPGRIDTPLGNLIAGIAIRRLRGLTLDTERGRRFMAENRGHGVNLVRNHLSDLDRAGVRRAGRVTGVTGGRPVVDGEVMDAATVVWCTGSRPDLAFVDIPDAFGPDRWPDHVRGIASRVPGLAFMGLPFQYSVASPTLMGMGRDAEYVVDRLYAAVTPQPAASVRAA
ncbi:flavin-containing monooxygenase [Microbacterium kyungheense]|uniref:Putative flavoprotein involved in K+ transport n=1 Tax=Microbacterium kyungheense TaxID=1263636 RepID=A0A543ESA2_9MICO|nr:NAD(P)-binding domain-containing protein [Microbacterium kyungheense]TQM24483.1 putative flavoprotein involved in K+ transport [Microbacterium kyungheense]